MTAGATTAGAGRRDDTPAGAGSPAVGPAGEVGQAYARAGGGPPTRYFTNVLGVFQGGGVRGTALAGAYAEARSRGVRFSAVAGTSAGSIVAALIASGATPDDVRRHLAATEFKVLLRPPDPKARLFAPTWKVRAAAKLARLDVGAEKARALVEHGMYSADALEMWVDGMLRTQLGRGPGDPAVTFADLSLPLYVVAANLRTRRAQVWGRRSHPTMPVAAAVRRSASIPFFFQPARDAEGLYVDGGSLSNLPAFVYQLPDAQEDVRSTTSRILAFRLVGDAAGAEPTTVEDFAMALADTHVEGNIDLQLKLQANVHSVVIPTGRVKATDFETITPDQQRGLWDAGVAATRAFLNAEAEHVRDFAPREYRGAEEMMYLFTSLAAENYREVTLLGPAGSFVFSVVPALLHAARDGLAVRAFARPLGPSPQPDAPEVVRQRDRYERHARAMLQGLGGRVVDAPDDVPWEGFVFRAGNRERRAVVAAPSEGGDAGAAFRDRAVVLYSDPVDRGVIDALERDIERLTRRVFGAPGSWREQEEWGTAGPAPVWLQLPQAEWEPLLRRVPQYRDPGIRMAVEDVPLAQLQVVDTLVKEYRIPPARRTIRAFREAGRALFEPCYVTLPYSRASAWNSLVTPPVFEVGGDGRVTAVEGVTRCFLLAEEGQATVRGIVVREVGRPLPGETRPLDRLRVASHTVTLAQNVRRFDPGLFRRIEESVHPFPFA